MGTRAVAEGAQGATRGTSRRVFVGGLVASVRPEELRRRFEAFGAVGDVAVKTRSDETGTPIKTFAYVSLQTSDAELRKCFSVLNHTKWKGGTLQLELAKEGFLQRLEKERAERAAAKEEEVGAAGGGGPGNPPLLVALNAAGAANFHMRGVVPGTEVPGVPDWVVSKFGRVLPIVKVRRKDKKKVIRYDPSKFCHNLKRLAAPEVETPPTPVSQLTWQLHNDHDDDKKKKTKRPERPPAARRGAATPKPASHNNRGGVGARGNGAESDEVDSEEELAHMVEAAAQAEERPRQRRLRDDGGQELEVVPVGFVPSRPHACDANDSDGEDGGSVWLPRATDRAVVAVATGEARTARLPQPTPKCGATPGTAGAEGKKRKRVGKSCPHCSKELAEEDEEDDEEEDEEYAKMMQGCYRLELSLDDLRAAVSGSHGGSPDDNPSDRNKLNGPEREPRVAEPEPQRGAPTPGGSSTTRSSSKKKLKRDSVDRDVDEVCDEEGGLSAGRHSSRPPLFLGTRWLFGDTRDGGGGGGGGPGETAGLPALPAPGDESGRGVGDEVEEEKQEEEVLCRKSKSKKRKNVEKEVVEEEEEVKENAVYCKINSKTKRNKKKKEEKVEEEERVCHKNKKKKKRKEEKDEEVEEERGHTEVTGSQPQQEEEGREVAAMSRPGRIMKTGFGEDERFRLDGRFEEDDDDDDEEGDGPQGGGDGVETPGGSELKQPKSGGLGKGVVPPASSQQDPKGAKRTTLSKAERRQRREEERWGPPVSAATYYHVTSELKQLFGGGQEEKGSGVVDEGPPPTQFAFDFLSGGSGSTEARNQGGFSFCFSVPEEARELAPAGDRKSVPFQPDGSFHDSSSEEEEQDEVEEEKEVEGAGKLGSPSTASGLKFFFFTKDDARLTEGPQSFCRSEAMEEVRDCWEEMRANLRQDYRKKHKDAIRKSRTKPGTSK